jgi:hypothetical protein
MFLMNMSTSCIGCERKIRSNFEIYCLDCEYALAEIEELAFNNGYSFGQTSYPEFQPSRTGVSPRIIVRVSCPIEEVMYRSMQNFLIRQQHFCTKDDVTRSHYTQSFLDGYAEGYKIIYQRHTQKQLVLQQFLSELGKRYSGICLISYILQSTKINQQLVDFNLVPLIRKYIL